MNVNIKGSDQKIFQPVNRPKKAPGSPMMAYPSKVNAPYIDARSLVKNVRCAISAASFSSSLA
jgi:hypothetical protein